MTEGLEFDVFYLYISELPLFSTRIDFWLCLNYPKFHLFIHSIHCAVHIFCGIYPQYFVGCVQSYPEQPHRMKRRTKSAW